MRPSWRANDGSKLTHCHAVATHLKKSSKVRRVQGRRNRPLRAVLLGCANVAVACAAAKLAC